MRNFVYLSNDDIPLANATVTWVMDKAREELKHSDKICGFLYGTATWSAVESGSRITYTVNTGGLNGCVLDLMMNFASNIREMTDKAGPVWFSHLPWRKRAIVWLLMLLAW